MQGFDVQHIGLEVTAQRAFEVVADPRRLPEWTEAFAEADDERGLMRTPQGEVTVELSVEAASERGTVDWRMRFPDGSLATAFSRLVDVAPGRSVYTFVLTPPPVPLEALEGALEEQSRILARELARLKEIVEREA